MRRKFGLLLSMLLIISFGVSCGKEAKVLNLATKPVVEQYLVSTMLKTLIENNTDIKVNIDMGVGSGLLDMKPKELKGHYDIYPEHTRTAWNGELDVDKQSELGEIEDLKDENQYDDTVEGLIGFKNTYAIAVKKSIAKKYDIKTFSDLTKIDDKIAFGAEEHFFIEEEGYDALKSEYGIDFKTIKKIELEDKVEAIENYEVGVITAYINDKRLDNMDLVVLEDDKNIYPSFICGFVIEEETKEKYPEILEIFSTIECTISDRDMEKMYYEVEVFGIGFEEVARNYLFEKGLID